MNLFNHTQNLLKRYLYSVWLKGKRRILDSIISTYRPYDVTTDELLLNIFQITPSIERIEIVVSIFF